MVIDYNELENEYKEMFHNLSDDDLIQCFNGQVRNPGTGTAKSLHNMTLLEEFKARQFDINAISSNGVSYSFARKIKLVDKIVVLIE